MDVCVTSLGPEKKQESHVCLCSSPPGYSENLFNSLLFTDWVSQEDSKYMGRDTVA